MPGHDKLKPLTSLRSDHQPHSAPGLKIAKSPVQASDHRTRIFSHRKDYQSPHSRRGSGTAHTTGFSGPNSVSPSSSLLSPVTSLTSLPSVTLGSRQAPGQREHPETSPRKPHPYEVILPGEEVRQPLAKLRTMSTVAYATAGAFKSSSGATPGRATPVGSRRFTYGAHSSTSDVRTLSTTGTSIQAAALHARRFSSVARGPSAASLFRNSETGFSEQGTAIDEAKKRAKAEVEMLLPTLRSLLGRDGGGEAVAKLFAFVFHGGLRRVKGELISLFTDVMAGVPTLSSAYARVYIHEMAEQLVKLGGLLSSEPEIAARLNEANMCLQGLFTSQTMNAFTKAWFTQVLDAIVHKLTAFPIYQSAVLKLTGVVCQFIVASEAARDAAWAVLSRSLLSSPPESPSKVTSLLEFLNLIFAAVEQLSGGPVKPFLKHLMSWVAVVDDLLTKLALKTKDLLSRSGTTSNGTPGDYTLHPLGYIYSPSESALKFNTIVNVWSEAFLLDPIHRDAWDHLRKSLDQVLCGIAGNSTFARFARDLDRVFVGIFGDHLSGAPGTGIRGMMELSKALAVELVNIPLPDLEITSANCELRFSDLSLRASDVSPSEFTFSRKSKLSFSDCSLDNSIRLELNDLGFTSQDVMLAYTNKAQGNSSVSGSVTLSIDFHVNLAIDLIPKGNNLQKLVGLPYYGGAEVKATVHRVHPTVPGDGESFLETLGPKIAPWLENNIVSTLGGKIDSLMAALLVSKPPTQRTLTPKLAGTSERGPISGGTSPANSTLTVAGNARDQFKASVRNFTGAKTGPVLSRLPNPLSGAPSPIATPGTDEGMDCRRRRRQSMADYLTEVSRSDSTLTKNIHRPPVAEAQARSTNAMSLPNVFDDDEDELPAEFETMARSLSVSACTDTASTGKVLNPQNLENLGVASPLSYCGTSAKFPNPEMSYEAYEQAEAELDHQHMSPHVHSGYQGRPSMAQSLSELAIRDATTEEAIAHPPTVDVGPGGRIVALSNVLTMDQVTRHLSGFDDSFKGGFATMDSSRLIRSGKRQQQQCEGAIMADHLTEEAMEDNTLPETQATGKLSGPVEAHGLPICSGDNSLATHTHTPMGKILSREASVDTTLLQNIARPPGARSSFRHPPPDGITGLKTVRSMSMALDDSAKRDFTTPESLAEMNKLRRECQPLAGLSNQEMRKRQSFKLAKEAEKDTTLLESIRNPPVANLPS